MRTEERYYSALEFLEDINYSDGTNLLAASMGGTVGMIAGNIIGRGTGTGSMSKSSEGKREILEDKFLGTLDSKQRNMKVQLSALEAKINQGALVGKLATLLGTTTAGAMGRYDLGGVIGAAGTLGTQIYNSKSEAKHVELAKELALSLTSVQRKIAKEIEVSLKGDIKRVAAATIMGTVAGAGLGYLFNIIKVNRIANKKEGRK